MRRALAILLLVGLVGCAAEPEPAPPPPRPLGVFDMNYQRRPGGPHKGYGGDGVPTRDY